MRYFDKKCVKMQNSAVTPLCFFFDGKREHNSCLIHILSPFIFSDIISDLCSSQENLVYCQLCLAAVNNNVWVCGDTKIHALKAVI